MKRPLAAPRLALALLAAAGCAGPEAAESEPAAAADAPPNILVVLVDTLRADRLSLYGYERETSPHLDRFARERGVVFENAWANAGCTFPSVNSILTGRWPQLFLERFGKLGMILPADVATLGDRLRERGFSTSAISASSIVRATPSRINQRGGFDRGFDRFDETCHFKDAACINARAFAELQRLPEPFLLYLHYIEPHAPYSPPPEATRVWSPASADGVKRWAQRGKPFRIQQRLYEDARKYKFGEPEIRHLSDLYDEEVHYFDSQFAELVAEIDRRGLSQRTILALVADHGEELYDNGHWAHCRSHVWDTILETPFLLAVPGIRPGARRTLVSNIDLMPTLLDLAGIPEPERGLDGTSLVSLLERDEAPPGTRRLFAAQGLGRAARDDAIKVSFELRTGQPRFRELLPGASSGGAAPGPRERELLAELTDWVRRVERSGRSESVRDAEKLEAELKALGYL